MNIEGRISRLEKRPLTHAPHSRGAVPAHIAEFATDPRFLGLKLFPVQLLILKVATLSLELLTDWDHRRLAEWMRGYQLIDDRGTTRFDGSFGTTPDLYERMRLLRAGGRPWFRNVVLVAGRRSGKSLLASILMAWALWKLLERDDPHAELELPAGKQITFLLFSTTREAAARDVFADLAGRIRSSECFKPFFDSNRITTDSVRLYTRAQLRSGAAERGEPEGIVLVAAPTVPTAARGPAVFGFTFDELAYLDSTAAATGTEIVRAARPASAKFADALFVFASTPASQAGAFYEEVRRTTMVQPVTHEPTSPDRLLVHLPTRAMSEGWQDAAGQPKWPGGPAYPTFTGPLVSDEELERERCADPENSANEFDAIWRAIQGAYFSDTTTARLFARFRGEKLTMAEYGRGDMRYVAHGDPAVTGDNFAFFIGHTEAEDQLHVIIDFIHHWAPSDFDDGEIDYLTVEDDIEKLTKRFHLAEIYFDHLNSAHLVQNLQARVNKLGYGTRVGRKQANPRSKFERYELLKRMINEGRVHSPYHQLLYDEMRFLQRRNLIIGAPGGGPVKSDDHIDALSWLVHDRLAAENTVGTSLGSLQVVGTDLDPIIRQLSDGLRTPKSPPRSKARPNRDPRRNGY